MTIARMRREHTLYAYVSMARIKIIRPIVRSFEARFAREAAAHVRAGGHAVVWDAPRRAKLVVRKPAKGDDTDLGYWSMLDLGCDTYKVETSGALAGLASLRVPKSCLDIVRARVERDSVLPGPTRAMKLDCLACGACCRDNEVVLEKADVARFVAAGRADLTKPPYTKTKDGRVLLVLRKDKRCKHLAGDNKCGVYELRPWSCSAFPMGSECCLFAREEVLGIIEGLATGAA